MSYHQARQDARLAVLRRRIAVEAARLMSEGGIRDFKHAKRKAARKLDVVNPSQLPRNVEIRDALAEHQRLFTDAARTEHLAVLRETARKAMEFFGPFRPRLVGAVLEGIADEHSAVCLHLFADTPEEVALFLSEQQIPFDQRERVLRFADGTEVRRPVFQFEAGEAPLDLTVFPTEHIREAPLSGVDGRPMRRAKLEALRRLFD